MINKNKIFLIGTLCLAGLAGFMVATNNADTDQVIDGFKSTTDGSYFTKNLRVAEEIKTPKEIKEEQLVEANGDGPIVAVDGATPGFPQGLWSNSAGGNVTPEQFNDLTRQVYGTYAESWIPTFGLTPEQTYIAPAHIDFDPFRDRFHNTVGLIHYFQGGPTPWGPLNQNVVVGGNAKISSSGCGPTGLSIIFSTMLQRYITPSEVVAARDNYSLRHQGDSVNGMRNTGNTGAMVQSSTDVCKFVSDQMYQGKSLLTCSKGGLDQTKVNETLDAGGMILLVTHASGTRTGKYWTGGGHYVVIRAHDSAGNYYTSDGSHDSGTPTKDKGNHNVAHSWADIADCGHQDIIHYIVPGPGYGDYLNTLGGN